MSKFSKVVNNFKFIAFILVGAIIFIGCPADQNKQMEGGVNANQEWKSYVAKFLNDYFEANPVAAVYAGKHEYDGKLPDWSKEGLKKEIERLKNERKKASEFKDESLSEFQQFERDYVIAQIDNDLFWLEIADSPHTNPTYYGRAIDPDVYVSRDYAPLDVRIKAYTEYAKNVPRALAQAKANLKLPLPKTYVAIGRKSIGRLAEFYAKNVPSVFASVKDEKLQSDFKKANDSAIKAVKDFDNWLKEQEASATDNFALGAEKFSKMLKMTEGVGVPLDKLEEIAKNDLERNLKSLKDACEKLAPGKNLQECMKLVTAKKPEGKDVIDVARKQLLELKKFVIENDIVSIPAGTEECKVDQAPPFKAWNFAYIDIPGPYEKGLPSVYYISPPNPSWSKEKQADYIPSKGSLLSTSVHEAYPGHFTQFLHSNRSKSEIAKVFVGYAYAEGWAHYTEEMMWDAGLSKGDHEIQIGQLQDALLRNIRFLSAIGLHTKGMSVEESKKMFMEKAFQDEGSAEQQANRGTFDQAYLNYTMGKLMITKLREDWTASRGGQKAWKEFHDKFLSYGGPPIPLVRKAMMGKDDKGSLF